MPVTGQRSNVAKLLYDLPTTQRQSTPDITIGHPVMGRRQTLGIQPPKPILTAAVAQQQQQLATRQCQNAAEEG
jgi:hypothetical protein